MNASAAGTAPDPARLSKNGLYYTRWGLVLLFFYLLLGDFCVQLMELVVPSLLPLQLDHYHASDTLKAVLMGTPMFLFNLLLNPYVSFTSDNLRTAWGRRRPILIWTTPLVTLAMFAMAFAPEISAGLGRTGLLAGASPAAVLVGVLAALLVVFQITNYLMSPVFYYLFVDVVPDACMGRFISCFRIVAMLAGYLFNEVLYQYADYNKYPHASENIRWIYLGSALLYFAGFMIMSLCVKEGVYPPPVHAGIKGGARRTRAERLARFFAGKWDTIKVYAKECYTHPHYWLFYARNAFWILSGIADLFLVFYVTKGLGIDLSVAGHVGARTQLLAIFLLYPLGILADRFKAVRVMVVTMLICLPLPLLSFLYVQDQLTFVSLGFTGFLLKMIIANLDLPMYAAIPPQERYGQFGSANQLVISVVVLAGIPLSGMLFDRITPDGKPMTVPARMEIAAPAAAFAAPAGWVDLRLSVQDGGKSSSSIAAELTAPSAAVAGPVLAETIVPVRFTILATGGVAVVAVAVEDAAWFAGIHRTNGLELSGAQESTNLLADVERPRRTACVGAVVPVKLTAWRSAAGVTRVTGLVMTNDIVADIVRRGAGRVLKQLDVPIRLAVQARPNPAGLTLEARAVAAAGLRMTLASNGNVNYRYCFLWSFVFFSIATGFMILLYRSWCKHGGPDHYVPPRVD